MRLGWVRNQPNKHSTKLLITQPIQFGERFPFGIKLRGILADFWDNLFFLTSDLPINRTEISPFSGGRFRIIIQKGTLKIRTSVFCSESHNDFNEIKSRSLACVVHEIITVENREISRKPTQQRKTTYFYLFYLLIGGTKTTHQIWLL